VDFVAFSCPASSVDGCALVCKVNGSHPSWVILFFLKLHFTFSFIIHLVLSLFRGSVRFSRVRAQH